MVSSKRFIYLFLLVLLLPWCIYSDVLQTGESLFPITNVQIYRSQALVTRASKVNLKKGLNNIVISRLPAGLIDSTARVKFEGDNNATIREIRIETINIESFSTAQAIKANKLLKESENTLKELTQNYNEVLQEEKFLMDLKFGKIEKQNYKQDFPIDIHGWQDSLQFKNDSLQENHKKSVTLLGQIDTARENLAVALAIAERFKSENKKVIKDIYISIESPENQSATVVATYRINNAWWYPVYSARVLDSQNSSGARVQLQAFALVKNETGENWSNTKFSFSAADPSEQIRFLSLQSWKIKPVEQIVYKDNEVDDDFEDAKAMDNASGGVSPSPKQRSRTAKPAEEKIAIRQEQKNVKYKKMAKKDLQVQNSLKQQLGTSSGFYQQNKKAIPAGQSRQKTERSESLLSDYKSNIIKRNEAQKKGDYQSSLEYNNAILDNIENIPVQFQEYFIKEKDKAEELKSTSLRMIENQKYIDKLIKPVVSKSGFDFSFHAPASDTILTDGSFHKIFLKETGFSAQLGYESAPLESKYVFLNGKMKNPDESPILAGPVSVFFRNNYLGESILSNINKGQDFSLNLGNDENIKITRKENSYRESEGLLTKKFNYKKEILVEARNLKSYPVQLSIFDRIPVSEDENIVVKDIVLKPAPVKQKENSRLYMFQLDLKPGEKKSILLTYHLVHSKDFMPIFEIDDSIEW